MKSYYIAVVHEENGNFGVSFPDLPGCITAGESLGEALDHALEALAMHIEGMQEDGIDIPTPSEPSVVRDKALKDGEYYTLAPIPVNIESGLAKRINITLNEHLIERIDALAKAKGLKRSAFIAQACKNVLHDSAA